MTPLDMVYWIAAGCFAIGAPAAMVAVFVVIGWGFWNAHQNTLARQLQASTAHVEAERKLLVQRDVSARASADHINRMKMLTATSEAAKAIQLDSSGVVDELDKWRADAERKGTCICGGPRADGQHDKSCPHRKLLELVNTPKLAPRKVHDSYAGSDFDPYSKCECDKCALDSWFKAVSAVGSVDRRFP